MADVPADLRRQVDELRQQADTASAQGRWSDAERLHRLQLHLVESELGKDHFANLAITANLAQSLHKMGRLEDAYTLQRDVADRWVARYKLSSTQSLNFIRDFARTLRLLDKTEEYAFWQGRLVDASREAYGRDSWKTVRATAMLARAKHQLGNHRAERGLVRELLLGDLAIIWKWLRPWKRLWISTAMPSPSEIAQDR